jgi:hypothetical protein
MGQRLNQPVRNACRLSSAVLSAKSAKSADIRTFASFVPFCSTGNYETNPCSRRAGSKFRVQSSKLCETKPFRTRTLARDAIRIFQTNPFCPWRFLYSPTQKPTGGTRSLKITERTHRSARSPEFLFVPLRVFVVQPRITKRSHALEGKDGINKMNRMPTRFLPNEPIASGAVQGFGFKVRSYAKRSQSLRESPRPGLNQNSSKRTHSPPRLCSLSIFIQFRSEADGDVGTHSSKITKRTQRSARSPEFQV